MFALALFVDMGKTESENMNITPELSEKIEANLKEFISNPESYSSLPDLKEIAFELKVLPMLLDMGGCYAIRPNGEIVSFAWDEPYDLEIENNPRIQNIVLFQGSKKYPGLSALVPTRPPDARNCDFCDGTGTVIGLPADMAESIVCYCGGLGWLP